MKKFIILLLSFFIIGSIYAEEGVLLFYPSLKFAEMSGGYPAKIETDLVYSQDSMSCSIKIEDRYYPIKFLNHASFCPCENGKYEVKECPEMKIPTFNAVLFFHGHLEEIKILSK